MKTKEGYWKLSPSGLYGYTECKACFWIDNHYKKVPSIPPVLNTAMDEILKNRYDKYRAEGKFPPEVNELSREGVKPFQDTEKLNEWRGNMQFLRVVNESAGYILQGKIDDVLIEEDGRLVPADYKSSGNAPKEDKQKYYIDQLAAYGFMFESNGHKVSGRAYLLHYFPKDKTNPDINIEFDGHVDRVNIGSVNIEEKLKEIVKLLNSPYPGDNPECEMCTYFQGRARVKNEGDEQDEQQMLNFS